jgi:hypothetical protein
MFASLVENKSLNFPRGAKLEAFSIVQDSKGKEGTANQLTIDG